ncbi:MAG: hypothetical protein LC798_20380 [Chloroflexi bacterium]|nr:hypothetical protein [Chloroflexota bacterium]
MQAAAALPILVLVVVPNLYLSGRSMGTILAGGAAVDWHHFVEAGRRVTDGGLYDIASDYGFRYSPIAAYAFAFIAPMGELVWRLIHVVAAFALPSWPMRLIALIAWPFWFDVEAGNVLVFVLLAAAWAVRGSNAGIAAFVVMSLLMPRPLMVPIIIWILWARPDWRIPFAVLFSVHVTAVMLTGWGPAWLSVLIGSGDEIGSPLNLGPSRWIGLWWLVIGIPLAAWLTLRGRLGWASIAASPYWLPYYLLMPILELASRRPSNRAGT